MGWPKKFPLYLQIMVTKLSIGCESMPPCQGGYFTPPRINLFGHLCSSWGTSASVHYLRPFPRHEKRGDDVSVDKSAFFLQKLVDGNFLTHWTILNSILSSFKLNLRRRVRSVPPNMEFWSHAWSHWNKIFKQWSKWNNIRYIMCFSSKSNNTFRFILALPVMCVNIPLISIDFAKNIMRKWCAEFCTMCKKRAMNAWTSSSSCLVPSLLRK